MLTSLAAITVLPGATASPIANFTGTPLSGSIPLTVNFTDASTNNPTSWAWDFTNDGVTDSTSQNPSNIYSVEGTYSVKLTATNASGSGTITKLNYINAFTTNYNSTTLLLPGEGTNGQTNSTYIDSSPNNFTITKNGDSPQGSVGPSSHPVGYWSAGFGGATNITTPTTNALNLYDRDFTIECWIYLTKTSAGYQDIITLTSSSNTGIVMSPGRVLGLWLGSFSTSTYTVPLNTWVHVAWVRSTGGASTLYANGTSVLSTTYNVNLSSATKIYIGSWYSGVAEFWNGWISNLRVVRGSIVYTGAFTPSTTPLTAIAGTVLLTGQQGAIVDGSPSNLTLTINGTAPTTTMASPFCPFNVPLFYNKNAMSGSFYSDGYAGDYLSVPYSSQFGFDGDFTVEFWVNWLNHGNYGGLMAFAASSLGWEIVFNGYNSYLYFVANGASIMTSSSNVLPQGWSHVAVVRSGSTITMYINGVAKSTATSSANLTPAAGTLLKIGTGAGGGGASTDFTGFMSNIRIVKGTAVYTSNFTPTVTPLTAIPNTSLLVLGQNAAAADLTGMENFETLGTVQVSTTQSKWGNGSLYFAGAGTDYISSLMFSGSQLDITTGNFTVETWIYPTSFSGSSYTSSIFTTENQFNSGSMDLYLVPTASSTTPIVMTCNDTSGTSMFSVTSSVNVSINTWTHVAWTRNGSTFTLWINGVSRGTATSAANIGLDIYLNIGKGHSGSPIGSPMYKGYMQDFRITKGVCRYTTTFTPPGSLNLAFSTPPTASFTSGATSGTTPLSVSFTDTSTGTPTRWNWNFSGQTYVDSTSQNASTVFPEGTWYATLTAYNMSGPSVATQQITVTTPSSYTTVLYTGQGTGGTTNNTFTDSSTNNFAVTRVGNATQGSFTPFSRSVGYWSGYFDGTGYITVPTGLNTAMAGGFAGHVYTIECFVNASSLSSSNGGAHLIIGDYAAVAANGRWKMGIVRLTDTTASVYFGYTISTGSETAVSGTTAFNINTWNHIAVTIDATTAASTTIKFFLNGSLINTFTGQNFTTQTTFYNSTPFIGGNVIYINPLVGYISNLRIVTGTILYTGSYTVPTTALTAVSGTSLLALQNNRIIDNSTNNFALTPTSATVNTLQPYNVSLAYNSATMGGSISLDGTGDYLSVAANSAFAFGSGNFTVEAWIYPATTQGSNACIFNANASTNPYLQMGYYTTTGFGVVMGAAWVITNGTLPTVGAWNHVAITRSGTTVTYWLNGVADKTASNSTAFSTNTGINYIGAQNGSSVFNGYISNLRLVNGTAVYTANFTPPSSPVTAIANTQLLLNGANAGIYDYIGTSVVETAGNTAIGGSGKWGGGAITFDGTGDYILLPVNPSKIFGASDFTMEMWVNSGANGTNVRLGGNGATTAGVAGAWGAGKWTISTRNDIFTFTMYNWSTDSTVYMLASTTAFNDSTWKHVAITRYGSTFRLFVNGVLESTNFSTAAVDAAGSRISLGSSLITGAADWAGSVNDFRITYGIARYLWNFTPPTSSFTS